MSSVIHFRPASEIREALMKSARAYSERFCFLRKFGKARNTVWISGFPNCTEGAKDLLLSRRRFIQRFHRRSPVNFRAPPSETRVPPDKLQFTASKPSPPGKVARRKARRMRGYPVRFRRNTGSYETLYRPLISQKSKIYASFPGGEAWWIPEC
mgnify:CR=1 FL=1